MNKEFKDKEICYSQTFYSEDGVEKSVYISESNDIIAINGTECSVEFKKESWNLLVSTINQFDEFKRLRELKK